MCVCYLSSSSPHAVSLEGAWTISSTVCWGRLHTHSSSPCRIQNRGASRSHRGQSCWGKSTQSSVVYKWVTQSTTVERGLTAGSLSSPPFFLSPIPWWQTVQQPPLGRVSAVGRSNAPIRFKLLSSGIRSKEQNSNSQITLENVHKTTLSYDILLSS